VARKLALSTPTHMLLQMKPLALLETVLYAAFFAVCWGFTLTVYGNQPHCKYYLLVTLSSFLCFIFTAVLLVPLLSKLIPQFSKRIKYEKIGLWNNTFVSCLHAAIIGSMVVGTFLTKSAIMYSDFQRGSSPLAVTLLSITTGYFVYDTLHMAVYRLHVKDPSIILHHFAIIACNTVALHSERCIPYVVAPLLSEVNSVFLHWRKLLAMLKDGVRGVGSGEWGGAPSSLSVTGSRGSLLYQFAWKGLWVTFLWFRALPCVAVAVIAWQMRADFEVVLHFYLGFSGISAINVLNFFLWRQLTAVQDKEQEGREVGGTVDERAGSRRGVEKAKSS